MKVKDFINDYIEIINKSYNNNDDRDNNIQTFIKKHIITDYVDFNRKHQLCEHIIKTTMYDEEGEFHQNSIGRYLSFIPVILKEYTDLELIEETYTEDFSLLDRYDLINLIIKYLPGKEYKDFNMIFDMLIDDIYANRNIISYIDKKLGSTATMFEIYENFKSHFHN